MDAIVFRFVTTLFDVTQERPNPINPIHGESLLRWLAGKLADRTKVPEPQTEDWGWYVDIDWEGRSYLLGASASPLADGGGPVEWVLQVVKHRSLKEKVLGREKMSADDPCAMQVRRVLESEPAFTDLQCD